MKLFLSIIYLIAFSLVSRDQEFLWANSYEISNCNEVAALAVDSSSHIFISGVYNASPFLPYTRNCYL